MPLASVIAPTKHTLTSRSTPRGTAFDCNGVILNCLRFVSLEVAGRPTSVANTLVYTNIANVVGQVVSLNCQRKGRLNWRELWVGLSIPRDGCRCKREDRAVIGYDMSSTYNTYLDPVHGNLWESNLRNLMGQL